MPNLRAPAATLAVAALVAVLLAVLAFELIRPREYATGTNGVGAAGVAVQAAAGQRVCVPEMLLAPGTARLRIETGPVAAPVPVRAEVTTQGAPQAHDLPAAGVLDVPVAPALAPERAELCLTPAEPLGLVGRVNPGPAVHVTFLPNPGAKRSLFAQLPDIARRAALFRPEPIGAWTYWLLLVAALPGLLVGAGVLFVRAARARPPRRPALAVGALAAALAASWALVTPAFNAPDEIEHFAYAQSVAERGKVPEAPPGTRPPYSSSLRAAFEGAGIAGQIGQARGRAPFLAATERAWRQRVARERPRGDDGGGALTSSYNPPGYYAALAPAYHAGRGSIFAKLTLMRLLTALLAGVTAGCVVLLVAELLPRHPWAAVGAGLLVALQPMAAFMAGVVNNDAAVNALAAALLALSVRLMRRGLSPRGAAALGALAVAGPLVKGSALFLLPAVALAVVLARTPRRTLLAAGAGAAAVAVLWLPSAALLDAPAWPLSPPLVAASQTDFPTRPGGEVDTGKAFERPGRFAVYLWEMAFPPLPGMPDLRGGGRRFPAYEVYVRRAWGAFGFKAIYFPGWVYAAIAAAMAAGALLIVLAVRRHRAAARARGREVIVLAVAALTVLLGAEAVWFTPDPGGGLAELGRYAFPALGALAAGAAAAAFGLGERHARPVLGAFVGATAVLHLASVWLFAGSIYT